MVDTTEKIQPKFNPSVLIHSVPKLAPQKHLEPITISDLNAEIAKMDKGIEFIPHVGERDHLLDAFIEGKIATSDQESTSSSI